MGHEVGAHLGNAPLLPLPRLEGVFFRCRRTLSWDSADTIATFAAEMGEFLKSSELTETKAFVRSFVKEIVVKPGRAAIVYSIPTPDDSPIGGADAAEIALNVGVMNSVRHGGPKRTVLRTLTKGRNGLCQKPRAAFLGQLLCLNMR